MNKNLTELVYVIDMSGSMEHLTQDTIGGYNSLIKEQKKLGKENPEAKANVTTVLFDDRYIKLYDHVKIEDVKELTENEYKPLGMTAMLDAIGKTINQIGQKLAETPEEERPGLVSVTIITDGYENSSEEYTWEAVRKMIKEQREKYSWVFSFIGANIDVEATSKDLGIDAKMSKKFTASQAGTASVFSSITKGTMKMRGMMLSQEKCTMDSLEDALSDELDNIK